MDNKNKQAKQLLNFPPVVSVLGHVDHGKTTLLDAIRKTNIVQKEYGGITQSIGASEVEIIHEGIKRKITFIDTPGHEAFLKMRSRGAEASNIGLLIVSAVDGVMPQTKESIKILQKANIPIIVVFTFTDLPTKNIEKAKQQVLKEEIMLEGLGGDVPFIEVSAKTNQNIKELLNLTLLVFDLSESSRAKEDVQLETKKLEGIVIESRLDKQVGPRATVIVKNGKIKVRDEVVCEGIAAKIKSLTDTFGKRVDEVETGAAVEVLGFEKTPPVGGIVFKKGQASVSPPAVLEKKLLAQRSPFLPPQKEEKLPIILYSDTLGSAEAVVNSLPKEVLIVSQKTGQAASSDILIAKSMGALIIGFRAKFTNDIKNMAKTEKVLLKNYDLIYELLDEIRDVLEGKKQLAEEQFLGKAKVLARFPFEKTEVMGISVVEGRVARGDRARLIQGENVLGESTVSSIRQNKEQISKIEEGEEGGIIVSPFLDFTIGNMLLFHR